MSELFPILILAGGLGTRVASITKQIPKSLIPIHEKPFIAHQLTLLAEAGFLEVIMGVGHLGEQIIDFVKDGSEFGLQVRYVKDGEKLLGTGGAIRAALPELGKYFFVMYGDSYLRCDYTSIQKAFENSGKIGLMTIYNNDHQWDASNVEYDGQKICQYSKTEKTPKMHHIDFGLNIFSHEAFLPFMQKEKFDLSQVQSYWVRENKIAAYEVSERFYEVGSIEGIDALTKLFKAKRKSP